MVINDYNISLISFKILDSNNDPINYITTKENYKTPTTISCIVYFPDNVKEDLLNNAMRYPHMKYGFYSHITYRNRYIALQRINIPIDKLKQTNFMNLSFNFEVPFTIPSLSNSLIEVNNCHIKLAISSKNLGEIGITESMRLGTFFETTVPVVKE